jgi:Zc3h12a-like ribonuclease protein
MPTRHVVVDGSNIGTEGRSTPSLVQLDEAVRAFTQEFPDSAITVVVDATFGHRIDKSEGRMFEDARSAGELVSPPAGAIGRGDAFLLRIADKVGATVLSNDSFQEFHGDYEWLFEKDRLIGGVPVPGIGWIFTPRTPVRGPTSRVAVQNAKRDKKEKDAESVKAKKAVKKAIVVATAEAETPEKKTGGRGRRRRSSTPPAAPVNEPLAFIDFVAAHALGSEAEGEVDEFTSHGAFVQVEGLRCYLPLTGMGEPPPRSAREVMKKGETRSFVIQAFDPPRRGVELALPGVARPAGAPTEETVEAEITATTRRAEGAQKQPKKAAPKKKAAAKKELAEKKPAKKASEKKKAAPKKAAPKKAPAAKKAAEKKKAVPKKAAAAKKAAKKSAPAAD